MKANLTQTQINQIIKIQDLCDRLRHKADNEDCRTYVRGYEVDREDFHRYLDCISASIEEMVENLLCF